MTAQIKPQQIIDRITQLNQERIQKGFKPGWSWKSTAFD